MLSNRRRNYPYAMFMIKLSFKYGFLTEALQGKRRSFLANHQLNIHHYFKTSMKGNGIGDRVFFAGFKGVPFPLSEFHS